MVLRINSHEPVPYVLVQRPGDALPCDEHTYVIAPWRQHDAFSFLEHAAHTLGPRLLVAECWQLLLPQTGLLIDSAISGGTLEARFREAARRNPGRCWFAAAPVRCFLPLPCPSGQGEPLAQLPSQIHTSHESSAFCCRYAYSENPPGVYLFDTAETLNAKQSLALQCGFCGIWEQPAD